MTDLWDPWATRPDADLSKAGQEGRHAPPGYLPDLLVKGRRRSGRSQSAAARAAGISGSYLCRLEQGQRCPSITVADALARTLHLTNAEKAAVIAAGLDGVGRDWFPNGHLGRPNTEAEWTP